MKLKKDIVIPAGTKFTRAPLKTERCGKDHFQTTLGLTDDTVGFIEYSIGPDDEGLDEWFE